jgi:transposase-like protein
MERIQPSERTAEAIRKLLAEGTEASDPKSELVRLAMRRIVEESLEGAVRDLLGRGYYEHGAEEPRGYRNGYRSGRLKTSEGEVAYASPQVRDLADGAEKITEVRSRLRGRTEELERLGVEMYARGCSTRDIEALFRGENGRSLLSKTAVSEITEVLWKEYEAFATRDLSELEIAYFFADGIAERLRPGEKRQAILAAWGITIEGQKVLIHLAPGSKESTECCRNFFEDLKRRGLSDPILAATDGAPGLIRGLEEVFPTTLRQRCLAHRMRNLVAKLPEGSIQVEIKQAVLATYQAPSPAMAELLRREVVAKYGKEYPSAMACFEEDFEACIAHLHCPPAHRRAIRTTNLLERLFGEERRRFHAVRTMFGEQAVLKLMYAALVRGSENWRGIKVSEFERRQLLALREQEITDHRRRHASPVTQPVRSPRFSSRKET